VSRAVSFPENLEQLQLPFNKEYEFALEMVGMGGDLKNGPPSHCLNYSFFKILQI